MMNESNDEYGEKQINMEIGEVFPCKVSCNLKKLIKNAQIH